MKLALTAGGTGGHILPALTVMDAVRQATESVEVRFFGPEGRGEREMVEARGLRFEAVSAAAVRGKSPLQLARAAGRLTLGLWTALRKLRAFRPNVVFSTGGYASFPCSLAARMLRIPLVVFLPDVEPGWAVRVEKRLATRIATTTEAARAQLPAEKTYVTGYPVREEFRNADRAETRTTLGAGEGPVVLVAGASQGAAAINRAVFRALPELCSRSTVVHITGRADIEEAEERRTALAAAGQAAYHPAAFRDDLPALMVASDLGVMRAGASVLGEVPAAALPSLLIPGRFAGGHQRANAQWLVDGGAAELLDETRIGEVLPRIFTLIDSPARLEAMRHAARALDRPEAATDIARIVMEVART
jgi:UDP-N-acetylglucosamine--N-acetylmuramyl-(pentapeptide) pyrophosphoryl-undecaprenol N-acetylglucosamine transferase